MRQSPMLNYPVSEYEARMSRAAEKVKQAGLSCIMGTSKAAVCHLTGLRSVIWESKAGTPGLLFLSAEGQYALVNSFTGVDAAMYSTCLERKDFMNYDSSGRSGVATNQLGAMCYTLRHFGCTKGKIGCELGSGIRPRIRGRHGAHLGHPRRQIRSPACRPTAGRDYKRPGRGQGH